MTIRCWKCGAVQDALPILVCPSLVGRNRTRAITSLSKKLALGKSERLESFLTMRRELDAMADGEIFTTQQFLRKLGWSATSNGDLARVMLDWNVCLGFIKKLEFNKGRKGNVYKKEQSTRCPRLANLEIKDKCDFSFKEEDGAFVILQKYREGHE